MVIKLHLHDELYIHIQAKQAAKTTNEIINYYKKAVSVVLKPPALNYMGFDYNLHKASFKHAINSYSQIRYALLLSLVIH